MSNDTTQKLPGGPSSFEERVFARFDALDARLEKLENQGSQFDARLQALENQGERFDARLRVLEDQGHQFDARFHTLETQAEQRALETKPIWERVLAEILEVKQKLHDLDRKFSIVTEDIIQVRADQVRLERRIDRLEPKPTH